MQGQLSLDMCLIPSNYVVQANELIIGRQSLSINEAKLIRLAIMQIVREDIELKPYVVKIKRLAEMLNISDSNIYRDIEDICNGISSKPVAIKQSKNWKYIPWVSICKYEHGTGNIHIKLNDELKPYLINLREYYTQYSLENVLCMKSIYAIRIFELIQEAIMLKVLPKTGTNVKIELKTIREACECEDKYDQFGIFKRKVIDIAIKEIERVTLYKISYEYLKNSRAVVGLDFSVNLKYH